jgi:DNA-binding NtrC family response regulator
MSAFEAVPQLIGNHASIVTVRDFIARAAPHRAPVVIEGETGTGKEIVARLLHAGSRRWGAFTPLNMAAIPEALAEAELFGVRKGAYTGAVENRAGSIEQAHQGTLFLDESGDTPVNLQCKLLRALDGSPFRCVGGNEDRRSDFRLVLSVQKPVAQLVAHGRWRDDFAYRVRGLTLTLPRLVDRGDDIALLAHHFLTAAGCHGAARPEARALRAYHWPGHVRELKAAVEGAVFAADTCHPDAAAIVEAARMFSMHAGEPPADRRTLSSVVSEHIRRTMQSCNGHVPEAARILGLSKSQLYRRLAGMNAHGLT